MRGSLATRLVARAHRDGDCLIFTGCGNGRGYGSIWTADRGMQLAHRVAWEIEHGPIPGDLTIDHMCESKRCIRVEHLQLVTREENQRLRWVRYSRSQVEALVTGAA